MSSTTTSATLPPRRRPWGAPAGKRGGRGDAPRWQIKKRKQVEAVVRHAASLRCGAAPARAPAPAPMRLWFAITEVIFPRGYADEYYALRQRTVRREIRRAAGNCGGENDDDDDDDDDLGAAADNGNDDDDDDDPEAEVSGGSLKQRVRTGSAMLTCEVDVYTLRRQCPEVCVKGVELKGTGFYMIGPYLLFRGEFAQPQTGAMHLQLRRIVDVRCMPFNVRARRSHLMHLLQREALMASIPAKRALNKLHTVVLRHQETRGGRRFPRSSPSHPKNGQVEDSDFDEALRADMPDVLDLVRGHSLYFMQKRLRETVGLYRAHLQFDMARFFRRATAPHVDELRRVLQEAPWELAMPSLRARFSVRPFELHVLRAVRAVYEEHHQPHGRGAPWRDAYTLAFLVSRIVNTGGGDNTGAAAACADRSKVGDSYVTLDDVVSALGRVVKKEEFRHRLRVEEAARGATLAGGGGGDADDADDADDWDASADLRTPRHPADPGAPSSSPPPQQQQQQQTPRRAAPPPDPLGAAVRAFHEQRGWRDHAGVTCAASRALLHEALGLLVEHGEIALVNDPRAPGAGQLPHACAPADACGTTRIYRRDTWDDMAYILRCLARARDERAALAERQAAGDDGARLAHANWRDALRERGYELNAGQLAAMERVLHPDTHAAAVTGLPGTGKTLFVEALLHCCDLPDSGRLVLTMCGKMSEEHRARFGIERLMTRTEADGGADYGEPFRDPHVSAQTIHMAHALATHTRDYHTFEVLRRLRVLVIDEAQNNNLRVLRLAYEVAFEPRGGLVRPPALVVHTGDRNQIRPIGRGKPFLDLMDAYAPRGTVAELGENKRCEPGEDDALVRNVETIVRHDPGAGVSVDLGTALRHAGHADPQMRSGRVSFETFATRADSFRRIQAIYAAHAAEFGRVMVVTATHGMIRDINAAIGPAVRRLALARMRQQRESAADLPAGARAMERHPFCAAVVVGGRVWFRKNYKPVELALTPAYARVQARQRTLRRERTRLERLERQRGSGHHHADRTDPDLAEQRTRVQRAADELRRAEQAAGGRRGGGGGGDESDDAAATSRGLSVVSDRVSNGTADWVAAVYERTVYAQGSSEGQRAVFCRLLNSGKTVCVGDLHVDPSHVSEGYASTVHSATGSEEDTVVVYIDPRDDIPWVGKSVMVVALSRARRRLYVVASRGRFTRAGYNELIARREAATGTAHARLAPHDPAFVDMDALATLQLLCSADERERRSDMAHYMHHELDRFAARDPADADAGDCDGGDCDGEAGPALSPPPPSKRARLAD